MTTDDNSNNRQTIAQTDHHPELHIIKQLVSARRSAKKTQAEIALSMNTTASAIARLESGGGKKRHSPSVRTLRMYADALGCDIQFQLISRAEQKTPSASATIQELEMA